jgi:hypothetical protein
MNHEMNYILRIKILEKFHTQTDFAAAAGSDDALVSRVIRGRRKLNSEQAKKWQKLLNCDSEILEPVTNGRIS